LTEPPVLGKVANMVALRLTRLDDDRRRRRVQVLAEARVRRDGTAARRARQERLTEVVNERRRCR
jgi:hypothetical protein